MSASPIPNSNSPLYILKKHWGYDSFRPLQLDIINSVMSGHDTLGLMPTGGGKSITFQVPGILSGGITIVITPLISLMKDQVDNLRKRHIEAVFFHSAMTIGESNRAWQRITNHNAKFIYIAPERLNNQRFIAELRNLKITLIVVDEAHCISQWGYDFRPSYMGIPILRKIFIDTPVLALTATATPEVATDICRCLHFRDGSRRFSMSFARNNISYIVRPANAKIAEILHILSHTNGSSIIYVRSRKRSREIAEYIQSAGINATFYHAGLSFETKETRQNLWKSDQVRVMVATNAFGMGIDKPDVRLVIHYDMPPSLEEYYQEAGRAGRDSLPSYAVLLTSPDDKRVLNKRLAETFPKREDIIKTYERVCTFIGLSIGEGYDTLHEFDFDKFCTTFKLHPRFVKASLNLLSQAGYLEFNEESDNRSRLLITATRNELYDLRLTDNNSDRVLLQILRSYPGLFSDYVFINEERLARDTNIDQHLVYESLLKLSATKMMHYIPRKRTPMIYVPTSREEGKYITIGKDIYESRKKVMQQRIDAIIDYAFNASGCRVNRMLKYFGEENDAECLKCDICRNKNKGYEKNGNKNLESHIADRLFEILKNNSNGYSIQELASLLELTPENIIDPIRFLCTQGFAKYKDGMILKS